MQELHLGELAADSIQQIKAQLDKAAISGGVPELVLLQMSGDLHPFKRDRLHLCFCCSSEVERSKQ